MLATNNGGVQNADAGSTLGSELVRVATCYYAHNVGVTFKDSNPIAQNAAVLDALTKADPENVTREDGETTFSVDTHYFAHFMHLVYCECGTGMKVRVDFDGIFPFDAPDQDNVMQKFNAQLVTISEVVAE